MVNYSSILRLRITQNKLILATVTCASDVFFTSIGSFLKVSLVNATTSAVYKRRIRELTMAGHKTDDTYNAQWELNWVKIERFADLGEIPTCIEFLLCRSGYDSVLSLVNIANNFVEDLESYLCSEIEQIKNDLPPEQRQIILGPYNKQKKITFLPGKYTLDSREKFRRYIIIIGHKSLLRSITARVQDAYDSNKSMKKPDTTKDIMMKNRSKTSSSAESTISRGNDSTISWQEASIAAKSTLEKRLQEFKSRNKLHCGPIDFRIDTNKDESGNSVNKLFAKVYCPICRKDINIFQDNKHNRWVISNLQTQFKLMHNKIMPSDAQHKGQKQNETSNQINVLEHYIVHSTPKGAPKAFTSEAPATSATADALTEASTSASTAAARIRAPNDATVQEATSEFGNQSSRKRAFIYDDDSEDEILASQPKSPVLVKEAIVDNVIMSSSTESSPQGSARVSWQTMSENDQEMCVTQEPANIS